MNRLTLVTVALVIAGATPARAQTNALLAEARRELAAGRYSEAATVYRRCLDQSPADTTVLGELSTALDAAGRWPEAVPYLERLVGISAPDVRRLTKLAQYHAWSGSRRRAADLFSRAYALDSANAGLLAAYGEFLSWTPQTRARGTMLLRRALSRTPDDATVRETLANAALESGHYMEAARLVQPLPSNARIRRLLADSLARATRVVVRADARSEKRTGQLSTEGFAYGAALPMGYGRLETDVEPLVLRDGSGVFDAVRGSLGWSYRNPSTPQLELAAGAWGGIHAPEKLWDARALLRTAAASSFGLSVGLDRSPIAETRRSLTGIASSGTVYGAAHATTMRSGVRLSLGAFEGTVDGATASIDGANLDRNRRVGVSGLAAFTVRSHAPWVRMGYEFRSQRFDHNAFDDTSDPRRLGGYFSPRQDVVHLGVLQFSQRLASRLVVEVDARAGSEAVRMDVGRPRDSRTATVVYAHAAWRVAHTLDLDAAYLHVNVFTAFRMNESRVALRRFF